MVTFPLGYHYNENGGLLSSHSCIEPEHVQAFLLSSFPKLPLSYLLPYPSLLNYEFINYYGQAYTSYYDLQHSHWSYPVHSTSHDCSTSVLFWIINPIRHFTKVKIVSTKTIEFLKLESFVLTFQSTRSSSLVHNKVHQ